MDRTRSPEGYIIEDSLAEDGSTEQFSTRKCAKIYKHFLIKIYLGRICEETKCAFVFAMLPREEIARSLNQGFPNWGP